MSKDPVEALAEAARRVLRGCPCCDDGYDDFECECAELSERCDDLRTQLAAFDDAAPVREAELDLVNLVLRWHQGDPAVRGTEICKAADKVLATRAAKG